MDNNSNDKTNNKSIVNFKTETDGLEVEFEVIPIYDSSNADSMRQAINAQLLDIDEKLASNQEIIDKLNADIDRLTSHADGWDYLAATCSGILTGLIDSFFIGEFDFTNTKNNIDEKFNDIVKTKAKEIDRTEKDQKIKDAIEKAQKKAQEKGTTLSDDKIKEIKNNINNDFKNKYNIEYKIEKAIEKAREKGETIDDNKIKEITDKINNNELARSIRKLEEKFGIPSDSVYEETGNGICSKSHHLDDLAHHPTVIGWFASILTQFTGDAYFQNKDGTNIKIKAKAVKTIKKGKEDVEIKLIGEGMKEKFFCGTINWLWHLVSDMAGSSSSATKGNLGMGIPGPILSMLKEFSMFVPLINKSNLPKFLNDLFTRDEFRFDLRSELALGIELGKQTIPVLINEALVRSFYFIRRFVIEIKEKKDLHKIEWKKTCPFGNRTIERMMTIATATFTVVDVADAAIRGAINSGGTPAGFSSQFLLRINYVGIGRFVIAIGVDTAMGAKRSKLRNERIAVCCKQLYLLNAKTYYKQTNMWQSAKNAEEAIKEMQEMMAEATYYFNTAFQDINNDMKKINKYIPLIENKNPGLLDDIDDILNWG